MTNVSEAEVEAAAREMANMCDTSIIEAPKLPWPCWMGAARSILIAAARVRNQPEPPNMRHGYPDEDDGPSEIERAKIV